MIKVFASENRNNTAYVSANLNDHLKAFLVQALPKSATTVLLMEKKVEGKKLVL